MLRLFFIMVFHVERKYKNASKRFWKMIIFAACIREPIFPWSLFLHSHVKSQEATVCDRSIYTDLQHIEYCTLTFFQSVMYRICLYLHIYAIHVYALISLYMHIRLSIILNSSSTIYLIMKNAYNLMFSIVRSYAFVVHCTWPNMRR